MRTNVLNDLSNVVKKGTGLACSWSQVGRMSEGAPDEHPMSIRSASDGERWKPAGEKGSTRVWKHVAMIFAVLVMSIANIGMAWADTPITWTPTSSDVSTLTGTQGAHVDVGTSTNSYQIYAVRGGGSNKNSDSFVDGEGLKFGDGNLYKSGIAVYVPSTSSSISSIEFYIKTTNSRSTKYVAVDAIGLSSEPSTSSRTLTTSYVSYSPFSTPSKEKYYVIGGYSGGSGDVIVQKIVVTFTGGGDTTPPTLSSSTPANAATDVAVSGNITLTFSENVTINDASKFTLSGGAGTLNTASATASGTVVTIPYSGLANNTTYTLATAANAVKDGSNNKNAALSNISFTTVAGGGGGSGDETCMTFGTTSGDYKTNDTFNNGNYTIVTNEINWEANHAKFGNNVDYISFSNPNGISAAKIYAKTANVRVTYSTATDGSTGTSQEIIAVSEGDYTQKTLTVPANTKYIKLDRVPSTSTYVNQVCLTESASSCTEPNHVDISGDWDYFGGETISLSAQAYSSAGTGSPIADGDITGYQWKHNGVDIVGATSKTFTKTTCTSADGGDYSCVVSTGATCSTESSPMGIKVYVLQCYTGGETTYNFTRTGSSQAGTTEVTLSSGTQYEFKIYAGSTASTDYHMGNNGTIDEDASNWDFEGEKNNVKLNSGLGGTFTFAIDYSANGGAPKVSVTYPRKTIYLTPGVWNTAGAKFAFYYFRDGGSSGWTDLLTNNDCGMSAEIPQWNGVKINAVRLSDDATVGTWDKKWNQTSDITVNSNNSVVITDWGSGDSPYTYGTYSIPTYTISYNAGTGGSGSKSNETKTCGVAFTLPNSAVFTRTGYTQTGWTTSDGGAQTHALGGTYTTNEDKTFYPVWTVNNYDLTWNLGGGTTTSAGTGIGSGVSSNTTTSQAFGTALTAPTVTKTGYNFSAWSPAVASTMPAANTTYTATWTVKTTTITIDANTANHGSTTPGSVTATYGSALPSFTAATGASGYSLTGYYTDATSGTKIINADGTLVASTSYADGSGNWNSEAATLTLYAQYEEEVSCPSSGTLYSAAVKSSVSSNQSFAASATTEVNTSTQADITGGKLYAINGESSAKNLIANSSGYKFCMTNNSTRFKIEMDCALQEGDIITIDGVGGTKNDAPMGLWVSSSESRPGSAPACVGTSTTTSLVDDLVNYTVTSSDEYHGKTILYIHRAVGSSTYFNNINISRPLACSTPASPSGLTNGATTANTQVVTWTANGEDTWEVYYSTSSSTPGTDQTPTATVTSATYTFTGLTASTTYYWWARSKCDDTHKSAWVAGSSFTTSAAPASALITYNLNVGTSASTTIKSSTSTTDGTNITNIDIDQTNDGANGAGASDRTTKLALATGTTASAVAEPDKYEVFTFKVACGKKVTPSEVKIKVANVGGTAGGNQNYKAVLSDTYGHSISNTFTGTKSDGTVEEFSITNGSSVYFQGVVTLKLWSCKGSDGNASAFRMGTPLEIYGEVANQATPAATITWNTQPANGRVGDPDFAYDVTCSDGSAVTVTSANTTYATIVGGKLHYAAAGTTHLVASATDACGNTVTPVNSNDFTVSAAAPTYSVTHSLTNVTATSGATGAGAATEGVAYDAVFAANSGYVLPSTITVTIGGSPATVGTGYTWNASTGAFQVPAAQVTGAIVITIAGETAPATKDIYYGAITITAGALTKGSTGTVQFFTNTGGTIANNTEISLSTTLGAGSEYYLSNDLTGAELSKSSNWTTSSSSNRYVQGVKFGSGKSYTLALGSKVASSITFYGINGSASKTMTIGGQAWTSSSTKNTFAKHQFTKSGNFTGNVSITQDGDFYGILVITIQTATPCTTPVIPALSNQTVCPGSDIAAWDATQTAVLADGETASYSWKKKGNDTEIEDEATLDLGAAIESMAGTYVVTVTVSKAGKASSSASKEVTLTVTAAVEEPVITANKATVYPGNSVTLTATCGTDGVTWNWYLCANADGTGAESSLGTSSSYTIASAGAAGTYYYKAVATGSCGTAEAVYTLVVSAASECEKYFWFVYAADATSNGVINNRDNFFGSSPKTGSSNSSTYKFTLDGTEYTATRNTGDNTFSISFTVPEGSTATLALNCKGSSSKPIYLIPTSGDPVLITDNSSNAAHVVENIAAGTYKVGAKTDASASWTLAGMAVQVCTASTCTDATPTITAANTTVCVGSELSISSTGYETGATFQWQKLNNSTSTWDNISSATSATYTVATAAAEHAGSYRLVATKGCARTSNTVTISVPSVPNFGSTVPASVSVMQTIALSINTVEATDAVKYKWYKSADATWDAGDTEIGTNKELIKAYDSEAIGSPSYYIFCRAQNACGITTSTAIAVNVTAYVEEDCATRGNESDAEFGFQNSGCGQGSYQSANCYTMNSNSKILVYSAPDGKYFKTMKVTIASSSASKASYNWSTNGGSSYTADGVAITGVTTTLTEKTINLSAHGNVNEVKIGRNFGNGESSGTLYVSKICFEYTSACTATTVTVSPSSVDYEMGDEWSNPTFTLSVAGTLTYSSSNEDIASVDDDGTVTFNGEAGTVTITASYAGDGTYCASSGSYTINVSCPGGAPKVVADGSVDMSGCNSSVILNAKTQTGADFADGTYQWFRNGEEIDGATSSSYTATQAGTYTVARTNTSGCTTPSTNSAIVTSETTEPEVERLVPFQYYHVNKTYSDQMKMRHLFAVKNSGTLDGKHFKMYVSRNGEAATDVTSSNALVVWPNGDGHVDTVMVDLNKLSGKYSANDELVFTCKAIDCSSNISDVYKNTITMNVIGATPTLALICSGSSKASGTRKTSELTVGGDFLTGYNVADLCQQTGNTSFDANTEWGLYTRLKENYIVTPVNGYAVFNKLNYEPFDILLLTDYPKASKSDAAATVLDDMADLCDYRPMLSFKAHMVSKSPSKWAAKGFTTSPVVPKNTRTRLNIVCYAHPMFSTLKSTATHIQKDNADPSQIVYTMLTGAGYESSKGLQGFELEAAENFVTIGLVHYNATPTDGSPSEGFVTWAPGSEDRMLVTAVERQENPEARMIMFAVNCGAQSKFTETGRDVVLKCLEYLLTDATITPMADCSFTFDNGAGNSRDAAKQAEDCPSCTGTKGDGKWSTAANWGPDYVVRPGKDTEVKIAAPVTVDPAVGDGAATNFTPKVRSVRILEGGQVTIPAGSYLEVVSTIRRQDGSDIYPTEENDIHIGSGASGNGTLIFNNNSGDTKARVDMYSNAKADMVNMSATTSTWQYIGTPYNDVASATHNYYDSWLYQYSGSGWEVIPNGGPLVPFRGYCVTHPDAPVVFSMEGTLAATTSQDIAIPAGYTVIANSWVAPIDINAITDDDMEGITDKTIYFFNTGTDAGGTAGTGTAAGTYRATPIHSSSYTGDWQIPSMQGFYVSTTTAGTFHLDYERHVRPAGSRTTVDNPMYAPRRAAAESDDPNVLKIFARGSRYQDKLVVLEREDFTRGYDSGWDGEAWGGSNLSPMVYVTGEGREDAVSAIPEFEGTVVAFKAGEDSEYRFEFIYDGDESLYLFDTENNTYTQIMTGESYYFSTDDKAPHSRFILTRKAPQIATGVEPTSDGEGAKARKLLIEDKMYILLNGMLYDATGKVVK